MTFGKYPKDKITDVQYDDIAGWGVYVLIIFAFLILVFINNFQ